MKPKSAGIFAVVVLAIYATISGGCALLGPSVDKAAQVVKERQADADAAYTEWQKVLGQVDILKGRWEAFQHDWRLATENGDTNALETLKAQGAVLIEAGKQLAAELKDKEALIKSTADVVAGAMKDFEDAKSTSDYIGTILGWGKILVSTLLGGAGVGGAVSALAGRKLTAAEEEAEKQAAERDRLAAAARITAANAHNTFSGNVTQWQDFLKKQEAAMAAVPGAREALRAARS